MHDDDDHSGWRPRYEDVAHLCVDGTRVLRLDAYPVAERSGLWCESCQLPSVVSVDVLLADNGTLRLRGHGTIEHCMDCHDHLATFHE